MFGSYPCPPQVDDSRVPMRANQSINEQKLRKYFLNFFLRMLKNYHNYMVHPWSQSTHTHYCFMIDYNSFSNSSGCPQEAPSETVVDKFLREKYVNDLNLKNDPFMQQFLTSQLFQCFVDDRFEESSHHLNLEVWTLCGW